MEAHNSRVKQISNQITNFHKSRTPFRIYHGTTNSTRPSSRTHTNTLDISHLNHIIKIDPDQKTCLVEPNVPMDALVSATLQHNLVPPVIPEFPGITVGGAFAGTAGESSSFRHGFFEECVSWVEIVLADGEVVVASAEDEEGERADLFHGFKGTFGTLGVGTLFEVRLVDALEFVLVRYEVVTVAAGAGRGVGGVIGEVKRVMEQEIEMDDDEVQFVDGILFSRDVGVVVVGRMTDGKSEIEEDGLEVVTFSKASDPWFYLHVQAKVNAAVTQTEKKSTSHQELIPLRDYLFRYDRGAFWTGRYAFKYFITPFNWVSRWAFDGLMHTRPMYHALHRSGLIQKFIIQDMAVPWHNAEPFIDWLDKELGIYPLWLAPLKLGKGGIRFNPKFIDSEASSGQDGNIVLNVGVWGFCPNNGVKVNRDIEAKLMELRGMKWLYSQTFYTEDEFWSIYDRTWYSRLRAKYHAETLPCVYEKVGGTALNQRDALTGIWKIWPFAGVYGVLSTLKGGDYLRKR